MAKVTIKELAKITGWSVATVSRALNDKPEIAQDKRNEIRKLAKELGYHPNQNARSIKLGKSKTIGVIVSSLTDIFSTNVISGIEEIALKNNLKVLLTGVDEDFQRERETIENYFGSQVDGLIIVPSTTPYDYTELLQGIPTVFVDRDPSGPKVKFNSVCFDNVDATKMVVNDMFKRGAQRIGLLNTCVSYSASLREQGYREALKEHGVEFSPSAVVFAWNNKKNVQQMTRQLVINQHCDGLLLADDSILVPALKKAKEYENENKLIFGVIDDCDWYDLLKAPVTSVKQPYYEIGVEAVKLLIELLKDEDRSIVSLRLKGELISRR